MFYLLHGEDEYRRSLELLGMKAKLGDPTTVDLNTTELDGRRLSLDELVFACDSLPFLAEKRLIIVNDLAARLERESGAASGVSDGEPSFLERLEEYLSALPPTTRLVFVESHKTKPGNPLRRLVSKSEQGFEREFTPLRAGELARWIIDRVKEKQGRIDTAAVKLLAEHVGDDLRLLDHEIEKLLTYVGGERPIAADDVERLVSYVQEANIFHMVDALGTRDTRRAMELVEKLLDDGQHHLYLLRMITRQFRILLQIKELQAKGTSSADIRGLLGLHPFVAEKTSKQARNFSVPQLEAIYHRLLELDVAVKTGEMEHRLAINLFVTEACS